MSMPSHPEELSGGQKHLEGLVGVLVLCAVAAVVLFGTRSCNQSRLSNKSLEELKNDEWFRKELKDATDRRKGISGTMEYNPQRAGIHKLLMPIPKNMSEKYYPTIPNEWKATTLGELELLIILEFPSKKVEDSVYQNGTRLRIVSAATGAELFRQEKWGAVPKPYQHVLSEERLNPELFPAPPGFERIRQSSEVRYTESIHPAGAEFLVFIQKHVVIKDN
jgi:hypothetical protein